MGITILKFPSIVELIDFSLAMKAKEYSVNRMHNTITATFSKDDIEMALESYNAFEKGGHHRNKETVNHKYN